MDSNDLAVKNALPFRERIVTAPPPNEGPLFSTGLQRHPLWHLEKPASARVSDEFSLNGKLLLLYFLSSPVSTMIGLYYDSLRDIAHYTSLTGDDLLAAIEELEKHGLITYSRDTEYVLVRDFMETQTFASGPIKSPKDNGYIAVLRLIGAVQDEQLRAEWIKRTGRCSGCKPHRSLRQDDTERP